jgi:hypothetical protein
MKYTRDILKKFGMDKAKPIKTPMDTNGHLDLDLGGTSVDQKVYHFMIGSHHRGSLFEGGDGQEGGVRWSTSPE